jgi:hypothetical protein
VKPTKQQTIDALQIVGEYLSRDGWSEDNWYHFEMLTDGLGIGIDEVKELGTLPLTERTAALYDDDCATCLGTGCGDCQNEDAGGER